METTESIYENKSQAIFHLFLESARLLRTSVGNRKKVFEAFKSKGDFPFAAFSSNFIHHSNGVVVAVPGDSPDIYRRLCGLS